MNHIHVHIIMADGSRLPCGELVTTAPDSRGAMRGAFRYAEEYLAHPNAFAIDPNQLPLSREEFRTLRPTGVHAVFEDALPDDWGKALLIRKGRLGRGEQTVPRMLQVLGADGLGALCFFPDNQPVAGHSVASMPEIGQVLDAAYRYDAGNAVASEAMAMLFRAASSPGGARPKALVRGDDGRHWIAKFPSSRDALDMIAIEAATLMIARACGLVVPEFFVEKIGRRSVLFVERFDIASGGGRRHMISAQTLLGAEGYYVLSYSDLFLALRGVTCKPTVDLPALFRQMVFNAAIGNTDDHLKNFTLLHDHQGFFLSPAYDLLPDTAHRQEHVLQFFMDHRPPGREQLMRLAEKWRIKSAEAILDEVVDAVHNWRPVFEKARVPLPDIRRLEGSIRRRLKKMKGEEP